MSSTPMLPTLSSSSTYSTSSVGSQAHRRATSGSFRIDVDASAPTLDSPTRSPTSKPRIRLRDVFEDASSWRVGGGSSAPKWTGLAKRALSSKRTLLLVLGALSLYVFSSASGASSARRDKLPDPSNATVNDLVPVVDRAAIDKLRLLEIHFGADEEQSDENTAPVDGVGSRGQAGLRQDRQTTEDQGGERQGTRDEADDDDDDDAPPMVVDVPQFIKPDPSMPEPLERVPASLLDSQVCPEKAGRPCSFLLAAWLGEQETKAQQHLHQLGMLAMSLNRTLVLPNVSKSRMGTCYANPFDFYYSATSLSDLGIPTITHENFVAWTLQRDPPPTAQVISMMSAKSTYPQGAIEIDSASDPNLVPNKPTRNFCLRPPRTRLDFTKRSPLVIYPPEGYHKNDNSRRSFGESAVNTLKSQDVAARSSRAFVFDDSEDLLPDVYAFNYELRYPMMSPAVVTAFQTDSTSTTNSNEVVPLPEFSHFDYSDLWHDLADVIVERLSPFIAIHWRTETLVAQNLVPCATRLVDRLVKLKQQYPEISKVYLATDYPIEPLLDSAKAESTVAALIPHSGTFAKSVLPQHHEAFRTFIKLFDKQFGRGRGRAQSLELTTFAREQAKLGDEVPDSVKDRIFPLLRKDDDEMDQSANDGNDQQQNNEVDRNVEFDVGLIDPGLYGILDKLIVTRSQVFLTGLPSGGGSSSSTDNACAKLSSFTNQMIEAREKLVQLQSDGKSSGDERKREELWNTVNHWSMKAKLDD
ncbi:hypothetical protein OIV83_005339 [Microbotryomycetes sp. JL201]|nr:hypothetical protein OIV83_005339 [Microbotryomycetes sp. JL201]